MANPKLLEKFWKDSGKTKTFLSAKINVSRPRLDYIFLHPETATVGQADGLSKELGMKVADRNEIFLPTL